MKTYHGKIVNEEPSATVSAPGVDEVPLPLRLDLRKHSPDGFSWGYGGSGPAQLALALLAHVHDDAFACEYYQQFKDHVIAKLPIDKAWTLTDRQITAKLVEMGALADDTPTGMQYVFELQTQQLGPRQPMGVRRMHVVALNTAQAWGKIGMAVQRWMDSPYGRRVVRVQLEQPE